MTATAPSAREIRNAVRDLSETQARILVAVETEGRAERSSRPTRDALIRKGIVERSTTGALVLTALGECVAAVLAPPALPMDDSDPERDGEGNVTGDLHDEPSAEDVLGACEVDEPGALDCEGGAAGCLGVVTAPAQVSDLLAGDYSAFPYCGPCRVAAAGDAAADEPVQGPERAAEIGTAAHALLETAVATDAGFGYGLEPTDLPEAAEMAAYLTGAGMSAGIDEHHGVVIYSASSETVHSALDGTGWAATALTLAGLAVPGMYVAERQFRLPPVPAERPCPTCHAVRGSGCATCRPDSVLGG